MREIKFRVWDKNAKMFTFDQLLHQSGRMFTMYVGYTLVDPQHNNYIIQQFTNLKDKNKKEIYEGDIVRIQTKDDPEDLQWEIDEIIYDSGAFVLKNARISFYEGLLRDYIMENDLCDIEVIGNILENPELLTKK